MDTTYRPLRLLGDEKEAAIDLHGYPVILTLAALQVVAPLAKRLDVAYGV
jgi:hypothetical protein